MHHIISDGWSIGVFIREFASLYDAFSKGESSSLNPLPIQYTDFAYWQRQWLTGEVLETQINYWQQQLAGSPALLELPTDHPRPSIQTARGGVQLFEINKELTNKLKKISHQNGATLFMTLLSAFIVLLYRYSGQEDIVVGSPIANRNHSEIESLIGFFVNTLALRTNLSGTPSFIHLLNQVRKVSLEAYAHQDIPFEKLVEVFQTERNLSHSPLFQVLFILQNAPMEKLALSNLNLTILEMESVTAKFDLTLFMEETEQGLKSGLEYNADLFNADTISRMAEHFQTLLMGIVADPMQSIAELPLLTKAEQHQLLVEWNNTAAVYPKDKCIHQLFEEQVEKTPDAVAVSFEGQQLTYQALNERANQLAHYLQTLKIEPDVFVGICVERSLEMLVGLLGILKAGGAYVPLDPDYPKERIAFMLIDSQASVLLTQEALLTEWPENQVQVVCLDRDWEIISQCATENLVRIARKENLAYVIYTSGSTGKPKGVQIQHQSLTNFLYAMAKEPGLTQQDVLLAVTTISFDIAGLELYLPLIKGAKIVLVSRAMATDGIQFLEQLNHSSITVMQATPATWRLLLASGWQGNPHLKILVGGEALPKDLANQLINKSASVWNMYGPTEPKRRFGQAYFRLGSTHFRQLLKRLVAPLLIHSFTY
jgi:non-ribosomal peptide synthetase component F